MRKLSEETKKKIGDAQRGKPKPWLIGKKLSDKHKEKLSQAKLKNPTRFWKGKHRSEETKQKIGKKLWKGGYKLKLWHARHRRVIKLGNGGIHTLGEWETLKAQHNWTCPSCLQQEPKIKLTVDHIIPLKMGGSDNIENIQPLCGFCNNSKHTKIIKYNIAAHDVV